MSADIALPIGCRTLVQPYCMQFWLCGSGVGGMSANLLSAILIFMQYITYC